MRPLALQFLTWGTAAAAVSSAVWLSSTREHTLLCSLGPDASSFEWGDDDGLAPTGAGRTGDRDAPRGARARETTIDQ
jgi:hypothetical protein